MLSWAGGGGFEVAQVSPRFGTGYSSAGFGGIRRGLKKTAIREDILAA
ncbi:hypothetical protein ABIB80_006110 [Bradyrhizobium sp. i1.15.2]